MGGSRGWECTVQNAVWIDGEYGVLVGYQEAPGVILWQVDA